MLYIIDIKNICYLYNEFFQEVLVDFLYCYIFFLENKEVVCFRFCDVQGGVLIYCLYVVKFLFFNILVLLRKEEWGFFISCLFEEDRGYDFNMFYIIY